MKSLIETLYTNNVIFSYYGFIDNSVLEQVLAITKSKLKTNKENERVIERVCGAISESVENILKHNFYEEDARVQYKSLLIVSRQDTEFNIDTIIVVNPAQRQSIQEQLDYLHALGQEELNALKAKSTGQDQTLKTVHSGLLDLVLRADRCDCTFKHLAENSLFNISYKVNAA